MANDKMVSIRVPETALAYIAEQLQMDPNLIRSRADILRYYMGCIYQSEEAMKAHCQRYNLIYSEQLKARRALVSLLPSVNYMTSEQGKRLETKVDQLLDDHHTEKRISKEYRHDILERLIMSNYVDLIMASRTIIGEVTDKKVRDIVSGDRGSMILHVLHELTQLSIDKREREANQQAVLENNQRRSVQKAE